MQAASLGPFRLTCENDGVRVGPDCAPAGETLDRGVKRQLIFNAKDEVIFELALRESFPTLRFMAFRGRWKDEIEFTDRLTPLGEFDRTWLVVPYADPWRPEIRRAPAEQHVPAGRQGLSNMPGRWLCYQSTRWCWPPPGQAGMDWAFDWPILGNEEFLGNGAIWGRYSSGDPGASLIRAFYRKVWRLLSRIATTRYALGPARHDQLLGRDGTMSKDAAFGVEWIGHCALEWSRAGGDRCLLAGAFRPADDWEVPSDPWYRRLKAEVEARYGADFGLPRRSARRTGNTLRRDLRPPRYLDEEEDEGR